jgi:hypothetical protein
MTHSARSCYVEFMLSFANKPFMLNDIMLDAIMTNYPALAQK